MDPYCAVGFQIRDGVVSRVWHCDYQHILHVGHGGFIDVVLIAVGGRDKEHFSRTTNDLNL